MAVPNDFNILQSYFNINKHKYNFVHKEDCGKFTEAFLVHLRKETGNNRYCHLRKSGSATQYNQHAIDVLAYDNREQGDGTPIMEIDILGAAESANAHATWQVRETPYQPKDLMQPEEIGAPPSVKMVPWVGYNEGGFQQLKAQLAYDYRRRPQEADFDVTVWAARVFHSTFMGPDGIPLGLNAAIRRHRQEWCDALGVPVDDTWL